MLRQNAWSLPLGSVSQTPVRLHLSFLLLGAMVAFEASASPDTFTAELSFVLALFLAVLIHEGSHFLAAVRLGVTTREVLLYPFGGVIKLGKEVGPRADLAITCAGPIGSCFAALVVAPWSQVITEPSQFLEASFATKFFAANVVLVMCNLIPAFPLDGGRILRSSLRIFAAKRATEIVVRVSQAASIFLGLVALATLNIFLIVIAAVIFSYSIRELVKAQALALGATIPVSRAMIPATQLLSFSHGTSLTDAANKAVRSFHVVFPVITAAGLQGYVTRDDLLTAASRGALNNYVGALLHKDFVTVESDITTAEAVQRMEQSGEELCFVVDDDSLIGLLLKDKLTEFLLLQGVKQHAEDTASPHDTDGPFF